MKENPKILFGSKSFFTQTVRYAPVGLCFSKFPLYVVTLRLCVLSSTTTYSFLSLLAVASSRFTDNVILSGLSSSPRPRPRLSLPSAFFLRIVAFLSRYWQTPRENDSIPMQCLSHGLLFFSSTTKKEFDVWKQKIQEDFQSGDEILGTADRFACYAHFP